MYHDSSPSLLYLSFKIGNASHALWLVYTADWES